MGAHNIADGNGAAILLFPHQMRMGVNFVHSVPSALQTWHVMISALVSVFIIIAQRMVCAEQDL